MYPITISPTPEATTIGLSKRGSLTSHENPSDGNLILGHTSLLTTFFLTQDGQFIISADRDEHIRISWYPQGYVIERFCLGHEKCVLRRFLSYVKLMSARFVTALHSPSFAPSILLSGGGDTSIKIWNWLSGDCLGDILIGEAVTPFLLVKPPKGRRGWYANDLDDDRGGAETTSKRKGGRRRGKGKRKANAEEVEEPVVYVEGTDDATMGESGNVATAPVEVPEAAADAEQASALAPTEDIEEPVIVIRRIESIGHQEQGQFFVFSVVGYACHLHEGIPTDTVCLVQQLSFLASCLRPQTRSQRPTSMGWSSASPSSISLSIPKG